MGHTNSPKLTYSRVLLGRCIELEMVLRVSRKVVSQDLLILLLVPLLPKTYAQSNLTAFCILNYEKTVYIKFNVILEAIRML